MALIEKPIEYWCDTCSAGPFTRDAKESCGDTIWNTHKKARHKISIYRKPEKKIDQQFNDFFFMHCNKWLHELIAFEKGPYKVCLLKDKPFDEMK